MIENGVDYLNIKKLGFTTNKTIAKGTGNKEFFCKVCHK